MWIHLVNSCVFNAHILHKKKGGKLKSLEFRTKLVSQIIEKYGEDTENYDMNVSVVMQHFVLLLVLKVKEFILSIFISLHIWRNN